MYKVILVNSAVETVIHYPTADPESPHLNALPLKEGLSLVDSLSFSIYTNSPGYDQLFELTTKVKVIDIIDGSVRFSGRVLDVKEEMDSNGLFYKDIVCEGALSFLNDSKQRANTFATTDAATFLTQILAIHNGKVDTSKQIQVGNVDVVGSVAYSCSFETTLAAILAVKNKLSGDIRVRETDGILYLDWLQSFSVNTVDVTLGTNMVDMVRSKDVTSLGTRIIPLGANNLTIGDPDYIDDVDAQSIYGVIEKTVEYKDITDATELYNTCLADLAKYTQPLYLLESNALDLSYLTGVKADQFVLGTNLHIVNPVMAVDAVYEVVQTDSDLLQPYDPKLTIANFPVKLTTTLTDLRAYSVQNNGVYNGVQIGDSFGVRVASTDSKTVVTVNATEGISIENLIKNLKVFYVDTDGNIHLKDAFIDIVTGLVEILIDPSVGIKIANNGTEVFFIDVNGKVNLVDMIASGFITGSTITGSDVTAINYLKVSSTPNGVGYGNAGFQIGDSVYIEHQDVTPASDSDFRIVIPYGKSTICCSLGLRVMDWGESTFVELRAGDIYMNNNLVATQAWAAQKGASVSTHYHTHTVTTDTGTYTTDVDVHNHTQS